MVHARALTTDTAFADTLAAAKQGDEWAWSILFHRLAGPVRAYLAARGEAEPDDLAGEVLLHVARGIHGFDGDESQFRSWVFVIAHRRLIDSRRRASRRPHLVSHNGKEVPEAAGGDVEIEAMEQLTSHQVREILEELTEPQRDVLVLRIIADLTLEETAEILGKRVGAVKALQRRALSTVRDIIAERRVTL